jgi:thiamine biosynthesis lipoprotein
MLITFVPPALQVPASELDREALCMGTRLSVHVEGPGDLAAASEAAFAEADRIERACSTWRPDSVWSRLNAEGQATLAPEWIRLLSGAKAWSARMGGAFDPVLGRLVAAWGARTGGRVPSPEEWTRARRASGAAHLSVEGATVRLTDGAWIEEGGFVKGYALDRMVQVLKARGATSGLLDFGGQLLAFGRARSVSIADPAARGKARLSLPLKDASLACSGDSERGLHLLDPRTGRPCTPWGEVAIVASTGFEADVLSKLFVLGPDRGLAWADAHGVAAAFLPNGGAPRMSRAFRVLNPTSLPESR